MNTKMRVIAGALAVAACLGVGAPMANAAVAAPAPTPAVVTGEVGTQGIIGTIIKIIQKKGPAVWDKCVKAVRAGWPAFKKWYDDLPWVVRTAIRAVSPTLTVYDIYTGIRDAIG